MLKKRLIPKLQLRRSRQTDRYELVTTRSFQETIWVGDPVSQAKIYQAQNVDELIFLNLESCGPTQEILSLLQRINENIFMPITIGGGIHSLEDVRRFLVAGADKVCINAASFNKPHLISESAQVFGSQCVVAAIDFKRQSNNSFQVWAGGKTSTEFELKEWAKKSEQNGAGEILLTSIDRDGWRQGLELEAIRQVISVVGIPVIASGGCGTSQHFSEGFQAGADGIAAGTFFCHQDQSPMQCRAHIKNAGFPIRMSI